MNSIVYSINTTIEFRLLLHLLDVRDLSRKWGVYFAFSLCCFVSYTPTMRFEISLSSQPISSKEYGLNVLVIVTLSRKVMT